MFSFIVLFLFFFPVQIQFEPTEYVKEFSGSVGLTQGACVVTYLRIETNLKAYELYDEGTDLFPSLPGFGVPMPEKEVPFSIPVPENTSIVGFFGRAGGDHLDAIGVYVKATNTSTAQETGSYLDDYSPDEPINLHGCRGAETYLISYTYIYASSPQSPFSLPFNHVALPLICRLFPSRLEHGVGTVTEGQSLMSRSHPSALKA
jgi:hypothetical protein